MEPLNYREIVLRPRRAGYSLEINESSDAIENRTLADDEDNFKGFSKKRMSKSTNDNQKPVAKAVPRQQNAGRLTAKQSTGELEDDNDNGAGDLTPVDSQGHKYFSVIEEGNSVLHDSMVGGKGLNMGAASIDSDTAVNNKNNRKLKRLPQKSEGKDVAFIEDNNFLQSQSFFNESAATPGEGPDERRAKSSLGTAENSAGRLRNRLAGVQKQIQNSSGSNSQQNQLMLI